jgi:hypothetical protein
MDQKMTKPDNSPNIVICWELGGGLGHLVKGAMLARRLLERSCTVSFAVRDLASAHPLLPEDHYCLVQAPYFDGQLHDWAPPADYAELLLHAGWGQASGLQARVRGWRGLFDALNADLIIADHSPTAVLAARTQGVPCVQWGHGFGVPTRPWPVFRTWEPTPVERLAQVRQHVLTTVNAVLGQFGEPGLDAPDQLLNTAACFLTTWPELDHYPDRGSATIAVLYGQPASAKYRGPWIRPCHASLPTCDPTCQVYLLSFGRWRPLTQMFSSICRIGAAWSWLPQHLTACVSLTA